jgi:hypothetical protein
MGTLIFQLISKLHAPAMCFVDLVPEETYRTISLTLETLGIEIKVANLRIV